VFRSALHASLGSSRFGSPCARCGRPFPTAPAAESVQPICRLCRDNYDTFDFARSYGVYKDALHHAILLLKYEGVTRLGAWFAARLAELVARASLRRSGRRWLCPFRYTLTASASVGTIKAS
jgi:predicted amidophosphoribosyltransferase